MTELMPRAPGDPKPSGLFALVPLLIEIVPVTLEKVSTRPGAAVKPMSDPGGKMPAPPPPGAGGVAWPAPNTLALPCIVSVTGCAIEVCAVQTITAIAATNGRRISAPSNAERRNTAVPDPAAVIGITQ